MVRREASMPDQTLADLWEIVATPRSFSEIRKRPLTVASLSAISLNRSRVKASFP